MAGKDCIVYAPRRPIYVPEAAMPQDLQMNALLTKIFGAWSSTRVGRFLQVNPRTVQRWLSEGGGVLGPDSIPSDLRAKVIDQYQRVVAEQPLEHIDSYVRECIDEKGIDKEVLATHLAIVYRRVTGTELE